MKLLDMLRWFIVKAGHDLMGGTFAPEGSA